MEFRQVVEKITGFIKNSDPELREIITTEYLSVENLLPFVMNEIADNSLSRSDIDHKSDDVLLIEKRKLQ